jgi:uncharacterized membrane protein YvlD (DUF360 family)
MANETYPIPTSNPNAYMSVSFLLTWLVSALVISIANTFFPQTYVLGTMSLSRTAALILSSGVLAWVTTLLMPVFTEIEIRKKMVLAPRHWILGYLIINVIVLWIIARLAESLGFGIASWVAVVGLAVVLNLAQSIAMMGYGEVTKKMKRS